MKKNSAKKSPINVRIVSQGEGFIVRAKVNEKKVELRAKPTARTAYEDTYATVDSAQRAWRKYSTEARISNYSYQVV